MADYCDSQDTFMSNNQIQNVAQLRNYIKSMLGSPTICVEISDEQLNDIIRDGVQYMWRYYYDEGSYKDYLLMELIPGKTKYKICQELESIVDFNTSNFLGGINDLFTVSHNLLYNQLSTLGGNVYSGMAYGSTTYGDVMGNFHATLVWMEEVKNTLGESFRVSYNSKEKILTVYPTPVRPTRGIMAVYKRQKSEKIFNDYLYKEFVVSKAGMLWTNSLRKYNLAIAGGGTLNADSMYSSYKERFDAVIERIDLESPNGHCMIVG